MCRSCSTAWVQSDPNVDGFDGLADDGWYFASDRMRVKHDNDYINDDGYEDRLAESGSRWSSPRPA